MRKRPSKKGAPSAGSRRRTVAPAPREAGEDAARLKSEFMATLTHEMRTPLNAILGVTDLLTHSPLGTEQREHVQVLHMAGESLLQMIDDVLDFSKLEAGKVALSSEPFDLRDCLSTVVGLFEPTAESKGISLGVIEGRNLPSRVLGDSARLRQVLVNIVGNALKFTERGSVTISVSEVERGRDHARLQFGVSDTGIGIPREKLARLFKPFSQVDASTTRRYGGTGLGLAISAELVRLMGGKMWVESEMGEGSTFCFTVRVGVDMAPHRAGGGIVEKMPSGTGQRSVRVNAAKSDGQPPSVLVAEDNPVNRRVIVSLLATLGCDSDVAVNGLEVLEAVKRKRYDIILMDIQMPEMDGLEASRHLVSVLPQEDRPVIIAVTAHSMKIHREECFAAGMDDYMSKPVRLDTLRKRLEHWTGHKLRVKPPVVPAPESVDDDWPEMEKHLRKLLEQTDPEFLKEFLGLFVSSGEEILGEVTTAYEKEDRHALERAAHSMLGASRNVGATDLAERCREIERLAPEGRVEMRHLAALRESFELTRSALQRFVP
jgi:CheY-like chemotaxis protein/HPt (histidine-containing phosphotransfer) domain-containing protein